MTIHVKHDSFEVERGGIGSDIAFVIMASDIARCPDHNMSVEHWRPDGTCKHENAKESPS